MPKWTIVAIFAGLLSLLASLPALNGSAGGFLLFYMAGLPLYLAGFAFGPAAGTLAAVSGFASGAMLGGMVVAGIYALAHALPAWTVIRQAMLQRPAADGTMAWYPPGPVVSSLAALAAALLATTSLALMAEGEALSEVIGARLKEMLTVLMPQLTEAERTDVAASAVPLLPGMAGSSWVLMAVVNALIAQGLLVRAKRNMRPSPSYVDLTLPDWLSWLLVGSAVAALATSGELQYVARNVVIVLAVPFFLLGLSVVHHGARQLPQTGLLLVAFYTVVLIFGWASLVVAGIGVLEQWLGIRYRLSGPKNGDEPDID